MTRPVPSELVQPFLRSRRGRALSKALLAVAVFVIVIFLPDIIGGNPYWVGVLSLMAINILMVSSLRSVTLINEISLGQVGFAIIGAYTQTILVMKVGMSFWAAMVLGGLLAAFVALLLGYPFLKVKGIYFSILTLLTAETFRMMIYYWKDLTGGTLGITGIPRPAPMTIAGHVVSFAKPGYNYYYIAVGVVVVCLLILYHFERSYMSFQWRMIRDDLTLAGATGVNVIGTKIVNLAVSAFMAGIAGGLFAAYQGSLSPNTTSRFAVTTSIYLLVYMVVGGKDHFVGPMLGTALIMVLDELARPLGTGRPIVTGAIAIVVMLLWPTGLVGLFAWVWKWLRKGGFSGWDSMQRRRDRPGSMAAPDE
jgi:branched-chain amino acid transport system permease protein